MKTTRKPFNNENSKANITGIFDMSIFLELWQNMKAAKTKIHDERFRGLLTIVCFGCLETRVFY